MGSSPTPTTTQLHILHMQSPTELQNDMQKWHCTVFREGSKPQAHILQSCDHLPNSLPLCCLSICLFLWRIRRKDVICLITHMTSPFFATPQFLLEVPHLQVLAKLYFNL